MRRDVVKGPKLESHPNSNAQKTILLRRLIGKQNRRRAIMYKIARLISAGVILWVGVIPVAQADSVLVGRASVGRSDLTTAARRIIPLALRGDAHAQAVLGFMYANGRGVPQSYDVAVDWYLRAAEQGDPTGQYLLGLMYDKGFGVTQDVIFAHKWLNLAAAHAPRQNRENILRLREALASKMTRAQLELAQQLAVDFVPSRRMRAGP
jgi:TPR repeat protein